jgi:class 3 adenylate cyclase
MAEALTQTHGREDHQSPIDELVAHLRAHPYKFDHSKTELAQRFGMDEEFVGDVLDTLRGSPNKLQKVDSFFKAFSVTARSVGTYLARLYEEFTERPVVAVLVTLVLSASVMMLLRQAGLAGMLPVPEASVTSTVQNVGLMLGGSLVVLHALVYFRHGMIRYAFFGSAIVLALSVSLFAYMGRGRGLTVNGAYVPPEGALPYLVFAGFAVSMFYFGFAAVSCLAGGYWHTNTADRMQKKLTRQELIDRLFYLQERLRDEKFDPTVRRRQSLAAALRTTSWLPVISLLAGFVVGAATVVLRSSFATAPVPGADLPMSLPGPVAVLSQVATGLSFLALGYLSGGIRRAVVALVLMFAGTLAAEMLPLPYFGPDYIEYLRISGRLLEGLLNALLLGLLVGVGAHIDKRARVRQKLQEHDPAYVTAEIVEIQWRLSPTAAASCVVVVDVAGSTRMKAEADPLAVEYSFRAFQDFIAKVTAKRGGTVLSTAGDGAVLTFNSCAEALYAAKEIQTKIGRFNSNTNRLPASFRVRIGVHTGQVSAQLQDVPFNELIDIAAHVEREAPVGGIAVTQRVVENLADERVAALKDQVDGQNVYVVLNPTLVV